MPTTRKNVSDYLRMTGWALLFLLIAAIVFLLIHANGFFFLTRWFAEYKPKPDLIALGIALIFLGYETYRFIKRTENPWQSIAVIVFFVIPVNVLFWVVWFIAKYEESKIGFFALGIFLIFLAYKIYKFIKRTNNPWQTIKGNLKKNIIIFFSFAFTIYACMLLFVTQFPTEYGRCDHYNEKLKGGVKEYQGRKFKVHLCGARVGDHEPDAIRLQVFNEKGDLLALRHFRFYRDTSSPNVLEYHPDHIAYVDDSLEHDFNKTITMPPTTLDWIRARIPLLD